MDFKLLVSGSRTLTDAHVYVESILSNHIEDIRNRYPDANITIVHGGAQGVDTIAEDWATRHNIPTQVHRPDYAIHGNRAPFVRNYLMARLATEALCIWDQHSKGTIHQFNCCYEAQVPAKLVTISLDNFVVS
jgi:hypothetical protein